MHLNISAGAKYLQSHAEKLRFLSPKRTEIFKSKQLALAAEPVPFGRCFYPKWLTVLEEHLFLVHVARVGFKPVTVELAEHMDINTDVLASWIFSRELRLM